MTLMVINQLHKNRQNAGILTRIAARTCSSSLLIAMMDWIAGQMFVLLGQIMKHMTEVIGKAIKP